MQRSPFDDIGHFGSGGASGTRDIASVGATGVGSGDSGPRTGETATGEIANLGSLGSTDVGSLGSTDIGSGSGNSASTTVNGDKGNSGNDSAGNNGNNGNNGNSGNDSNNGNNGWETGYGLRYDQPDDFGGRVPGLYSLEVHPLDEDLFASGKLRFGRDLLQPSLRKEKQLAQQAPPAAASETADAFQRAHDTVFRMEPEAIVAFISEKLGRLTVARVAGTPDVNSVSRWSSGRTRAEDARMERMRHAAYAYCALEELGFSANAAKFWFRGTHPSLGDEAPMDILSRGEYKRTIAAVRDHALRAAADPRWAPKLKPEELP